MDPEIAAGLFNVWKIAMEPTVAAISAAIQANVMRPDACVGQNAIRYQYNFPKSLLSCSVVICYSPGRTIGSPE